MRFIDRLVVTIVLTAVCFVMLNRRENAYDRDTRRPPLPKEYAEQRKPEPQVRPEYSEPRKPQVRTQPPSPEPYDIQVEIEGRKKGSATGTAFAIDDKGHWMTARHVVNECRELYLLKDSARLKHRLTSRDVIKVRSAVEDQNADIAILTASVQKKPLRISANAPKNEDQLFHYGFPEHIQGALKTRMIGETHMRVRGRYKSREPVYVLAEENYFPASLETNGGLSGGPTINDAGEVVGTTVASTRRRGRVYSSTLETLNRITQEQKIAPNEISETVKPADYIRFEEHGQTLEKSQRMQMVLCQY